MMSLAVSIVALIRLTVPILGLVELNPTNNAYTDADPYDLARGELGLVDLDDHETDLCDRAPCRT